MIQDLKFAIRQLIKSPGFTIAAVIVLGLGIGANTAVFSLVHTMLFAPPGYARPNEVGQLFSQDKKNPKTFRGFSYPTYRDIREQNTVFTDVMAYNLAMVGIGQKGDTRRAFAAMVSSNYFSVLGVPLAQGRAFSSDEETPGHYAACRDCQPRLLGETFSIRRCWVTLTHQRPSVHDCRYRGTRFHRYDAGYLTRSMAASRRLRSGSERFCSENNKKLGERAGQQLLIVGRLNPGLLPRPRSPSQGLAANLEKAFPVEQKDQTFNRADLALFQYHMPLRGGRDIHDRTLASRYGDRGIARGLS